MSLQLNLLVWAIVSLGVFASLEWIRNRFPADRQIDRRSSQLLAYYYSARIPWPADIFAGCILLLVLLTASAAAKMFTHWFLGLLTGLIVLAVITQIVWMRSVGQNQKVDMELPHFIGLLRSTFLATNGNERFALSYAAANANLPALVFPLRVLAERWENGADLPREVDKTKRFFRNSIVSHMLDAIVQEHYGGGFFVQDLDRLTVQARDRFRLAESRKVAIAGSVYALYGILGFNLLLLLLIGLFDWHGLLLFRELAIGKLIIGLSLTGYAGVMILAFRLIRLGES